MRVMIAIPCSFALLLALPALARATTQTWLVTRALCEVGELKFGMQTPIGQGLKSGGASSWLATAAGIGSVALHLFLAATDRPASWYDAVAVFATLATTGIAVTRRDAASFGFRLSPLQGWAYWAATAFVLVGLMGLVYWVTMLWVLGQSIPAGMLPIWDTTQIWPAFLWMCVQAPLWEEPVYRLALCPPLVARLGPAAAIVVGGILFFIPHVLWGVAGINNFVGGFVLAWAYLKSGTIAVPIALHALGNFCIFAIQVALFYCYHA